MHYNEFQAVKLARQLIEDEDDEDDDDDGGNDDHAAISQPDLHETASSEAASSVQHAGDTAADHMLSEDVV